VYHQRLSYAKLYHQKKTCCFGDGLQNPADETLPAEWLVESTILIDGPNPQPPIL
jgi:hypothetical protein